MNSLYNWIFDQSADFDKEILSTQRGTYTYRDIQEGVDKYIGLLESAGDLKKKKVALVVPPIYDYLCLVLAVSRLGGISVPLSPLLREEDLAAVLDFAEPHLIFTVTKHNGFEISKTITNWAQSTGKETIIFEKDDEWGWNHRAISGQTRALEESDIHVIGCTSGSTGTPKGVVAGGDFFEIADKAYRCGLDMEQNDKVFLIAPASGLYGLCWLISSLHSGYHLVITESFHFPEVIQLLEDQPSPKLVATPSLFKALDVFSKSMGRPVLDPIQLVCFGGEAVTDEFIQSYAHLPAKMRNLYGLSELGCMMYTVHDIREDTNWSLLPTVEYKIGSISEEGIGELLLRNANPFLGYYKRPDLTSEVYHDDWYWTGDLVRKTDGGKFEIIGRKKDMIKKGGQQVIPGEIERFIGAHPQVEKAVVVGIPHPVYGEQIIAFVKRESVLDTKELYEYCHDKIAKFKIPDQIRFIEEFPMTQGKVDKVTLRKLAAGS